MMTVAITRNVPDRFRGFLASVMLEITSGVYVSPDLNQGVRERVLSVCREWATMLAIDGSVTIIWRDRAAPGRMAIEIIGARPPAVLRQHDGLWLAVSELTEAERKSLNVLGNQVSSLKMK